MIEEKNEGVALIEQDTSIEMQLAKELFNWAKNGYFGKVMNYSRVVEVAKFLKENKHRLIEGELNETVCKN